MRAERVVSLCFLLAACRASAPAPAVIDTSAIDAALDAATERFSRGFETGQLDSVAALFTEDHFSMPPHQPPVSGRSAWLAWSKAALVGGQWTSVAKPESRLYGDSLTVERGRYVNTFVPAPDAPKTLRAISDTGKYVWIWRKSSEGWQLAEAIWNSNAAPIP